MKARPTPAWACVLWGVLALVPLPSAGLEVPPYTKAVNDLAAVLSPAEERRLEEWIRRYTDSTGIEIGVLTVATLDGASPENFAFDVFRTWGIGGAERDHGVLVLVAWEDRVARLEVGYGLEGALTDLESGRIVSRQSEMADHFRAGETAAGFEAVLGGIAQAVAGDYEPSPRKSERRGAHGALLGFLTIMLVILFLNAVARRRSRRMGVWGRGSWTAAGLGTGFGGLGGLGGLGRLGRGSSRGSGGGFRFGGGSSGGGGASGGW